MSKKLGVVILRNNLRINDNAPLYYAKKDCDSIIVLYPYEILQGSYLGFKKCGKFRVEFIKQTLLNLKENLENLNISLYVVKNIKETLEELSKDFALSIYLEKEVGVDEEEFEKKLSNYDLKTYFNQTMIEPFSFDFTKSFSHFRKKAEKLQIPKPLPKVQRQLKKADNLHIKDLDISLENIPLILEGGESNAIKRVTYYFENFLHTYYDTRSLFDGLDNSTKFSAYLSVGAISARTIYHELKKYEKLLDSSKSSYWIYFELLWRDFFYLVMLQSKEKLFLKKGILGVNFDFKIDAKLLDDFFNANTKVDIIDASIIELKSTGWSSNRARQLLISYFTKNLGLDFRYCAAFFQEYLIDFNPASNYGNIAYQAGVGNDKTYRVFDPIKQSVQYKGKNFVKKWLKKDEELSKVNYKNLAQKVKQEVYRDFNL